LIGKGFESALEFSIQLHHFQYQDSLI